MSTTGDIKLQCFIKCGQKTGFCPLLESALLGELTVQLKLDLAEKYVTQLLSARSRFSAISSRLIPSRSCVSDQTWLNSALTTNRTCKLTWGPLQASSYSHSPCPTPMMPSTWKGWKPSAIPFSSTPPPPTSSARTGASTRAS